MNAFFETLKQQFETEYHLLYNDKKKGSREQVERFDKLANFNPLFRNLIQSFAEYRHDIITSDREANAFMNAYDTMNA